mmetsp:Transcript_20079/g.65261  ORF Transcript_20079/g.65261 Transcript_20079/m.65261 type:complete len:289 (-) Transcript_20079:2627-3493(-)
MCASSHPATRPMSLCTHQSSIIFESVVSNSTSRTSPNSTVAAYTSCSSGESGGSSAAAASAAVACSLRSLKKRQIHAQASGSERRASQPSEMIVPMMRGWPSAKAAHARPRGVSALHKAADDVGGVILVGGPPGSGEPPASTLEGPRVICAAVGSTKPYSSSQRTAPSHSARSWLRVAINSASRALRVDTAAAIFGSSSPWTWMSLAISALASLCCLGFSAKCAPPKSPVVPASRDSSRAYRSAAPTRASAESPARAAASAAWSSRPIAAARRRMPSERRVRSSTSGP